MGQPGPWSPQQLPEGAASPPAQDPLAKLSGSLLQKDRLKSKTGICSAPPQSGLTSRKAPTDVSQGRTDTICIFPTSTPTHRSLPVRPVIREVRGTLGILTAEGHEDALVNEMTRCLAHRAYSLIRVRYQPGPTNDTQDLVMSRENKRKGKITSDSTWQIRGTQDECMLSRHFTSVC